MVTDLNTSATAAAGWVLLTAAFDITTLDRSSASGSRREMCSARSCSTTQASPTWGRWGGPQAVATAINNSGQVGGRAEINANHDGHAYLWTNGVMTDLGGSPGNGFNLVFGVNDFGEAAGTWASAQGSIPLFWNAAGTPTLLPLLDPNTTALSINNLRQIVGGGAGRAILWEDGVAMDLETFISPSVELASANAINNAGQVTGQTGAQRGFLIQLPTRPSAISALISGVVTDPEVQHSLLSKLDAAVNGGAPLCNVLRAARNEIDAQSGKKIPSDVATRLLDAIDVAAVSCP